MTLSDELRLSYYREIADIEADHGVFLVQDTRTKKIYVKKILPVYSLEIYQYLAQHPMEHTPRIRELAEDGNLLILIEEYIPGNTLQELLEQKGPLEEAAVLDICVQLCRILEAFHRCSPPIVNRDIKPSNILLTGDGTVKLLDLNAAKRCREGSRKDTVLIGTEGYAAPEQYGFGPSSVLTDVYSVGVLMNVLLTGTITGGQIRDPRLRRIISKCTELSPKGRYQSMTALRLALEALRGREPRREESGWKRFLPPGFRTADPLFRFYSLGGYAFLLYLCCTLQVEDAGPAELLFNRITITAVSLAIVLFSGNYLNVHSRLPLTRGRNLFLRLLGIALVDAAILLSGIIALSVAVSLLP